MKKATAKISGRQVVLTKVNGVLTARYKNIDINI